MAEEEVNVLLQQQEGYRFVATFADGTPELVCDEPPPLGERAGPSPMQLLAAAVGNCLCDSLLFAFRKFKQAPEPLSCRVKARLGRNAQGRLRVTAMQAELTLGTSAARLEHLARVLDQFEAFCTVTQSVSQAFPVDVRVRDAEGTWLK